MPYLLAIDQGTTGSTVIVFDGDGQAVGRRYREVTQHFPRPGWVEHDAGEIWTGVSEMIAELSREFSLTEENLAGIGIANQRETVLLWDRATGRPVHRAIVWQCRRTADVCRRMKRDGFEAEVRSKTGLLLDPYFAATKVRWLMDEVPGVRERAERGELVCGTIDSWIVWNLTHGRVHATDPSNASRTLLFNIDTLTWDEELLDLFGVPSCMLPEVRPTSGDFGKTLSVEGFPSGIPIGSCCGDQQSALFGQVCFAPGTVKNTYGTGAFLLMNAGDVRPEAGAGLLATVGWAIGDLEHVTYAVEGSVFVAGAVVQWLRDGIGLIATAAETEALAKAVEDNGGVYFVPAFVGLGAPVWDPYARGTIVGLTRGARKEHVVRAALESIAYQSRDVAEAMASSAGLSLEGMRVDGGAAANNFLLQFQADILGTTVERPRMTETTALGAAYLAGLSVGVWKGQDDLQALWHLDATFRPSLDERERERLYSMWQRAVERSREWENKTEPRSASGSVL